MNLKNRLFKHFASELEANGATDKNTKVVDSNSPPTEYGDVATIMPSFEGKIVTLIKKYIVAGAIAFILCVSIIPPIPAGNRIFIKTEGIFLENDNPQNSTDLDLSSDLLSGIVDIYTNQYGEQPALQLESNHVAYTFRSGDKIHFMEENWTPPTSYFSTLSGAYNIGPT